MITKNPEVGKYIVGQSIMTYGFSGTDFGQITKISGNRIYYVNAYGIENYVVKFSAICDTVEEAKKLQIFSKKCVQEVNDLNTKHILQFREFSND
jgi:hypothetical protein